MLLDSGANPSLELGWPVGTALCAAVDTACEHRRSNKQRLKIIDTLVEVRRYRERDRERESLQKEK